MSTNFRGVPARGTHVPYLVFTEVEAQTSQNYAYFHVAIFKDAIAQSRSSALATVDVMTSDSSPWWTFHTFVERISDTTEKYSLWSPVKFDDCDNALKFGTLFAKSYLTTDIEVIHFSATPFYDVNDPSHHGSFPPDAFKFPYFVEGQSAYYEVLERYPASNDKPSDHSHLPTTSSCTSSADAADPPPRTIHSETSQRRTRKRKLTDSSAAKAEDGVVLHRIIYHYFDHQVANNINSRDLDRFSLFLNEI